MSDEMIAGKLLSLPTISALLLVAAFVKAVIAQPNEIELPSEIVKFIQQRVGCENLAELKKHNPNETTQLDQSMRAMRCSDLVQDEQSLRARYADDAKVIGALDGHWVKFVERLRVGNPAKPPQ